jgi:hypothetical protein
MTQQLIAAMSTTAGEDLVKLRAMLLASGELALADDDARCLLFGALSSAIGYPSRDVYPHLVSAVIEASARQLGVVELVRDELLATAREQGSEVVAALARELVLAAAEASVALLSLAEINSPDDA